MEKRSSYLISKAFGHYLGASILSMLASQLSVMVDAIIVGKFVAPEALSGVNSAMPLIGVIGAFEILFGSGACISVARLIGKHDEKGVKKAFSMSMVTLSTVLLLMSVLLILFAVQVAGFLNSEPKISAYAAQYIQVYAWGIIPMQLVPSISGFVQTDGHPRLITSLVICESVCNLILDLLFVCVFGMGIQGAALATIISAILVLVLAVILGLKKSPSFRWLWEKGTMSVVFRNNLLDGLPLMLTNVLLALVVFLLNTIITSTLGTVGMNIWSVCLQVFMLSIVVLSGIGGAVFSIGGVLVGEKDMEGLSILYKKVMGLILGVLLILVIFIEIWPESLAMLFGAGDAEFQGGITTALRIFIVCVIPFSFVILQNDFLQIMEHQLLAMIFTIGLMVVIVLGPWIASLVIPECIWWGFPASCIILFAPMFISMMFIHRSHPGTSPFTLIPYQSPGIAWSKSVKYNDADLRSAFSELNDFLAGHTSDSAATDILHHIVEELMLNIVQYAVRNNSKQTFDVQVRIDDNELTAVLKDDGRPFDPTVKQETDTIGLKIVQGLSSEITYKYMNGQNVVFVKIPTKAK